jgi:S-adenosylmethionine:tRNA ribosyltransferase-isomerase
VARGIDVAPLVLHTGVSSLETGENPYPERYRVPEWTAERVKLARRLGGRVIAVGTTVVRALESVASEDGRVSPAEGWTELVIGPGRVVRTIDGLLTGFHDRDSSHLQMLDAIVGPELVARSYREAAEAGYLRHEFGDVELILRP